MERRQKILLALLGVMGAGYAGDWAYRAGYDTPLREAETRQAALEDQLHQAELNVRRQQRRLPELDQLKPRSLPRNPELAVSDYRSWLLQTLAGSGMHQANLDSSAPARVKDLYQRIDFSVRTRGTMAQLTELLRQFYATPYLHKIRSLSLTPAADGSLDVSMTIETLIVPEVADDRTLAPLPPTDAAAGREANRVISQRNLFRRGASPLSALTISAITAGKDRQRQAWLSVAGGDTRILSAGDTFTLDGVSVQIRRIDADAVTIAIDGAEQVFPLGRSLAEAPPANRD